MIGNYDDETEEDKSERLEILASFPFGWALGHGRRRRSHDRYEPSDEGNASQQSKGADNDARQSAQIAVRPEPVAGDVDRSKIARDCAYQSAQDDRTCSQMISS